jgi:hypothetical protein
VLRDGVDPASGPCTAVDDRGLLKSVRHRLSPEDRRIADPRAAGFVPSTPWGLGQTSVHIGNDDAKGIITTAGGRIVEVDEFIGVKDS